MPAKRERNLDLDLCDGFERRGQSRLCDRRRKGSEGKGFSMAEGRGKESCRPSYPIL